VSAINKVKLMKLPLAVKAVLVAIAIEADAGNAAPSLPVLVNVSCCGRSTVMRALSALELAGHLVRHSVPGKATTYSITAPPSPAAPAPEQDPSRSATRARAGRVTKRPAKTVVPANSRVH
jgi:hypothetical protein